MRPRGCRSTPTIAAASCPTLAATASPRGQRGCRRRQWQVHSVQVPIAMRNSSRAARDRRSKTLSCGPRSLRITQPATRMPWTRRTSTGQRVDHRSAVQPHVDEAPDDPPGRAPSTTRRWNSLSAVRCQGRHRTLAGGAVNRSFSDALAVGAPNPGADTLDEVAVNRRPRAPAVPTAPPVLAATLGGHTPPARVRADPSGGPLGHHPPGKTSCSGFRNSIQRSASRSFVPSSVEVPGFAPGSTSAWRIHVDSARHGCRSRRRSAPASHRARGLGRGARRRLGARGAGFRHRAILPGRRAGELAPVSPISAANRGASNELRLYLLRPTM